MSWFNKKSPQPHRLCSASASLSQTPDSHYPADLLLRQVELVEMSDSSSLHALHVSTRVVVNASGAPVLWRVNEEGFLRSSILNGTTMWFLQAVDGLVVSDNLLPLGQNYFLSKILQYDYKYCKPNVLGRCWNLFKHECTDQLTDNNAQVQDDILTDEIKFNLRAY